MRTVFSAQARQALRGIALYIARDNRGRALSFVQEMRGAAERIADSPRAFALVPRYEQFGIRRRPFGAYLIFYRVEQDRVVIVDILHSARDYEPLLFPSG